MTLKRYRSETVITMIIMIVMCLPSMMSISIDIEGTARRKADFTVSGWTFPWDEPTMVSISKWSSTLDEVSPYWYWVNSNGTITRTHNETEDVELITFLHQKGIELIPMISNNHEASTIIELSRNMSFQSKHIKDLVDLIRQFSYSGLDINYENIPTSERDGYSNFIMNLSTAFHSIGKRLYVSVFPKVCEDENREGPGGYNYERIGSYADRVRIMAYNLHWSTSPTSGPITSLDWMEEVITYASSVIPAHRIQLGVPQYGYDWVVNKNGMRLEVAENVTFSDIMTIQKRYDVERRWNSSSRTPFIEYRESSGKIHHLHYSDSESLMHQMKFIGENRLAGVSIWKLGGEDPDSSRYIGSLKGTGLENFPPFIDIDFSSITAMRGQEIIFEKVRAYDMEGPLSEISWDFGDGTGSSLIEPSHSYSYGGFFTASFRIVDSYGISSDVQVEVKIGPFSSFIISKCPDDINNISINASNSWDPEGILSYTWNMGDGSLFFHSDPVIEHCYKRPGMYNISLTIINEKGYTDVATACIDITDIHPPNAQAGDDIVTYEGNKITLDARGSSDDSGWYECLWDIEEHGSFKGKIIELMPKGPGIYQVKLIVKDSSNNIGTDKMEIQVKDDTPPEINVEYPSWVPLGSSFEINASLSHDNIGITNFTWDLGNGNVIYGQRSLHLVAEEAKRYYCTLHLYDEENNWNSSTFYVDVKDITPPYGSFKIDPTPKHISDTYADLSIMENDTILKELYGVLVCNSTYIFSVNRSFDDSGIGYMEWWFGDCEMASGPIVYHEYDIPGLYKVRFHLEDIWGNEFNSNITLLVIPRWNVSLNEIETIIHEYVNNTEYIEPEERTNEQGFDTLSIFLFMSVIMIIILGVLEIITLLSYQRRTLVDLFRLKRKGGDDDER